MGGEPFEIFHSHTTSRLTSQQIFQEVEPLPDLASPPPRIYCLLCQRSRLYECLPFVVHLV
ncbi:hypothetical protein Fmac_005505 [Flemingia macrophylla]|uniref:Uncharacterized protein n=1 Tax=Flemingia macrophylla TaxID=520843 RepID=A0ABD1N7Y1_9FABA